MTATSPINHTLLKYAGNIIMALAVIALVSFRTEIVTWHSGLVPSLKNHYEEQRRRKAETAKLSPQERLREAELRLPKPVLIFIHAVIQGYWEGLRGSYKRWLDRNGLREPGDAQYGFSEQEIRRRLSLSDDTNSTGKE